MLSRSNYMKVFNELDEIYTSKSFEHLSLLTFLNKNVYESPMIYWNINTKNEISYDCSIGIDNNFIELYHLYYKALDNLHPQKIGNHFLEALLHKDLKVKTSHIYSNLSDNSGMWSA
ncbi:hypothetical protein [Acinetobacter baumannii]|uniref:hypothetical protein n=1 Tax=Acinetobacter baumannii TaxID=470 RepID=UPI00111E6B46|nr:hypothetical protein [Acinetobacter baumannii]